MSDLRVPVGLLPLALREVGFRHGDQDLLKGITLQFGSSGKTLVMGPNGAGKSLLMRLCHGLLRPTEGSIRWHGGGRLGGQALRRRQAMVFQRPVLLRRSARANVEYPLVLQGVSRRQRRRQADAALERFGLSALAGRPARVLSGGEQQRLALARAWVMRPEILFLDEPTSALDPAATKAVEDAVLTFHEEGTRIVMSSHNLGQARRLADDVVFLCRGRLLEHSPAETFFTAPASAEAAAFLRGDLVW
ncbi:MAG: phosphate ABC transporter ATP-binding protein [Ectothiorhodospiraceae bacterium]|nr:phosphate ABC transporter ATP-binding protein [Ectothiorhodospiraceae bacterium]